MSLMEFLPTLSYFYTHTPDINTQIRMSEKGTFFNVKNWERRSYQSHFPRPFRIPLGQFWQRFNLNDINKVAAQ